MSEPRPSTNADPTPIPADRFPPRLVEVGYQACVISDVEVIVPPLCDVAEGAFLMGSEPLHDTWAQDNETPLHSVTLPAYQIAQFPVTIAEYACYVRAGHPAPQPERWENRPSWKRQLQRLDHPVVNITWYDALAYATWIARLLKQPWRLPSEAEWEKAARWDPISGASRIWPWGDTFDALRCNTSEGGRRLTTPVDAYPSGASPCGAQDLAGNVWEWVNSGHQPYPYHAHDGREAETSAAETREASDRTSRVIRGGSWRYTAMGARAAYRGGAPPDDIYAARGFRLVRALPAQ